jgi:putative glutamine amidotransferase
MNRIPYRIIFLFLIPFLTSFSPVKEEPMQIALSKASPNYIKWIQTCDPEIVVIDLNGLKPEEAKAKLHQCSGLVLTGGGDIDPSCYGQPRDRTVCKDVDVARDLLEKSALRVALDLKMPVLGICRGQQMLNVFFGGTLITDIPHYKNSLHAETAVAMELTSPAAAPVVTEESKPDNAPAEVVHQCDDYLHCYHSVSLEPGSFLQGIIGFDTGFVTTNHHQAVLVPGKGLKVSAWSADSIAEGIEREDTLAKPFMIGVQWHPERMDPSNAFSGKLVQRFVAEAKKYSLSAGKEK